MEAANANARTILEPGHCPKGDGFGRSNALNGPRNGAMKALPAEMWPGCPPEDTGIAINAGRSSTRMKLKVHPHFPNHDLIAVIGVLSRCCTSPNPIVFVLDYAMNYFAVSWNGNSIRLAYGPPKCTLLCATRTSPFGTR
jgi:hypothetical protein